MVFAHYVAVPNMNEKTLKKWCEKDNQNPKVWAIFLPEPTSTASGSSETFSKRVYPTNSNPSCVHFFFLLGFQGWEKTELKGRPMEQGIQQ